MNEFGCDPMDTMANEEKKINPVSKTKTKVKVTNKFDARNTG